MASLHIIHLELTSKSHISGGAQQMLTQVGIGSAQPSIEAGEAMEFNIEGLHGGSGDAGLGDMVAMDRSGTDDVVSMQVDGSGLPQFDGVGDDDEEGLKEQEEAGVTDSADQPQEEQLMLQQQQLHGDDQQHQQHDEPQDELMQPDQQVT